MLLRVILSTIPLCELALSAPVNRPISKASDCALGDRHSDPCRNTAVPDHHPLVCSSTLRSIGLEHESHSTSEKTPVRSQLLHAWCHVNLPWCFEIVSPLIIRTVHAMYFSGHACVSDISGCIYYNSLTDRECVRVSRCCHCQLFLILSNRPPGASCYLARLRHRFSFALILLYGCSEN